MWRARSFTSSPRPWICATSSMACGTERALGEEMGWGRELGGNDEEDEGGGLREEIEEEGLGEELLLLEEQDE
jgi:hypothetical protein